MSEELLKVDNLKVEYKTAKETVHAVNGVSFSLNKGETLGLVGETGAGKTTTALSILRLLPERTGRIISGDIVFNGKNLRGLPEKIMRSVIQGASISMIFQDPMTALNPVMTVGDQIKEALHYHYDKKDSATVDKRVDEVLEMVGISASDRKSVV
jgi:peptide/nickel transport system ATP-binding protein